MKRITALLCVLSVCVCLFTGCAGSNTQTNETKVTNNKAEKTVEAETETTQAAEPVQENTEAAKEAVEPVELIVFAAASMTETLEEIGKKYEELNPNVKLTFNFDSSGTLKTQIEEGADCDIFISAAKKQMDQLDINADKEVNTDGLDFVDGNTRIDLLENKVVLAVPEGNPKGISSYDDMVTDLKDKSILLAIGNDDVPVGQYTQKIFAYYELDEEKLAKDGVLTYGSNVKEVTTQVNEAAVDCGIIYSTDAFSANLSVVDTATKDMCGQVIYPAAVLKVTNHPVEAKAFLDYLGTADCKKVFESVGFTCL